MFRKRTKKAGQNLRRKRNLDYGNNKDGDDDNDEDDHAVVIAVRNTMKKHKILASLPLTSQGTATMSGGGRKAGDYSSSDQPQAIPVDASSSENLSVLATKHKSNMEAFIEQQMAATYKSGDPNKKEQNSRDYTNRVTSEEDLYQQLAREITGKGDNTIGVNNDSLPNEQQDGDQGDGGAALLGGTGIAEVILPSTTHAPVTAATSSRVWNKNSTFVSSAVPEEERHKHTLPDTTPKPFVKFRKTSNNPLPPKSNDNTVSGVNNLPAAQKQNEVTSDATRMGFDAYRGKTSAADYANDGNSDHQNRPIHQRNRMKTGKDRDDQVYSHFLKNALNGKNR